MAVKTIQSVQNALGVLEALAVTQPIGVSALARTTDLDKTAVQRILLTLGDAGWIRQLDTGEWTVTSKALQVGTHYTSGLREAAHPHLVQLQKETDETVVLFAQEGATMVVIDSVDSSQPLRMTVPIGMVVPMRQSATFDAFLPETERAGLPPMRPEPSAATLASVRRLGYFVIDELYPNAIAAGAPVFDRRGVPIATVTVVAPRVRVTKAGAKRFGERVTAVTGRVTEAMSGTRT
ncbi:MAG: IclR family transcriptional regulator [Ilumatobacteraceae bacterium]|nr:IclR family transcriptional regulator [Ilumatobacteraceae bacterium]